MSVRPSVRVPLCSDRPIDRDRDRPHFNERAREEGRRGGCLPEEESGGEFSCALHRGKRTDGGRDGGKRKGESRFISLFCSSSFFSSCAVPNANTNNIWHPLALRMLGRKFAGKLQSEFCRSASFLLRDKYSQFYGGFISACGRAESKVERLAVA